MLSWPLDAQWHGAPSVPNPAYPSKLDDLYACRCGGGIGHPGSEPEYLKDAILDPPG